MQSKSRLFGFVRNIMRILAGRPQVDPTLKDNAALQAVLQRRSVRSFSRRAVPEKILAAILEAGRLSPSTVNLQTWSFAVFSSSSWREFFERPIPFHASRAILIMADTHRTKTVLPAFPRSPLVEYTVAVINASLAAMNMTIAAEALGVSSVMLSETGRTGLLDSEYLRGKLKLPEGVYPLTTIVLGYRRGAAPPMPPKLPLEQICFEGSYKEVNGQVMQDWLAQMKAGYKASRPLSSFEAQLNLYQSKIGRAEEDLRARLCEQ